MRAARRRRATWRAHARCGCTGCASTIWKAICASRRAAAPAMRARSSTRFRSATPAKRSPKAGPRSSSTHHWPSDDCTRPTDAPMTALAGKRALVTGASGGIGRAIAERLAHDGAHVIVHAHSRRAVADDVAAAIRAAGGSAEACAFDLTDRAAFPALRESQWRDVIDVSLHGFFHVTQPLMMPMIRTRWGRIVTLSSVAAIAGNRGQVNYAAAKGALN